MASKRLRLDMSGSSAGGGDDGMATDDFFGEDVVFQLHGVSLGPKPEQWLSLVVKYVGLLLSSGSGYEAALEICSTLDESTLFHYEPRFRQHIQILLMGMTSVSMYRCSPFNSNQCSASPF